MAARRGNGTAISNRQRDAVLWAGRLRPGEVLRVPDAPFVHVFVARGAAELEGAGPRASGGAAHLTVAGAPRLVADPADGSEVLIWEMQRTLPSR